MKLNLQISRFHTSIDCQSLSLPRKNREWLEEAIVVALHLYK